MLASRGYEVKLCEAGEKLGGNLLLGGAPSFKEDDIALAVWYENELARLQVNVQYNTRLDAQQIREEAVDVVIFATGSRPKLFSLGDDAHVHAAEDVLLSKVNVGYKSENALYEALPQCFCQARE